MRTFISIEIPNNVKKEIVKIQNKLPEFYGKKTETEDLHLTLKFLGELPKEKINEIIEKLNKINYNSFEIKVGSIGVFSEKFIRIIWLYLTNCNGLQKKIDNSLGGLFKLENRFMSHLTIARVKRIEDKKKFLDELKRIKIKSIKFKVKDFNLRKSILTEKGPIYKDIEKYNLR
jgi:2'-5' RNA ligase